MDIIYRLRNCLALSVYRHKQLLSMEKWLSLTLFPSKFHRFFLWKSSHLSLWIPNSFCACRVFLFASVSYWHHHHLKVCSNVMLQLTQGFSRNVRDEQERRTSNKFLARETTPFPRKWQPRKRIRIFSINTIRGSCRNCSTPWILVSLVLLITSAPTHYRRHVQKKFARAAVCVQKMKSCGVCIFKVSSHEFQNVLPGSSREMCIKKYFLQSVGLRYRSLSYRNRLVIEGSKLNYL